MNDVNNPEINSIISQRPVKLTKDLASRLNRVEGQVRAIKTMIEKDVYCDDILTQIASVQSAINSVSKLLLESHLRGCVVSRLQSGDDEVIEEFVKTVGRLL